MTKVLVCTQTGISVIDLEDSSSRCNNLPQTSGFGGFGGLTNSNKPMLCNGDCWVFEEGIWNLLENYQVSRSDPAASQSPFDGQLWISGGQEQGQKPSGLVIKFRDSSIIHIKPDFLNNCTNMLLRPVS